MHKASNITRGGLFAALSLIFIYLSSIAPTNKLALLTLSSFIIICSILIMGIKSSFVLYISVSMLSFFLLASKGIAVVYLTFFGVYGFIKYYIEKLNKLPLEILLKLLFFNSSLGILFLLYDTLFISLIDLSKIKFSIYLVILVLQIAFLIYDYILTLFISYFNNKLYNRFIK